MLHRNEVQRPSLSVIRTTRRRAYGTGMTLDRAAIDAKKPPLPETAVWNHDSGDGDDRLATARAAIGGRHEEWDAEDCAADHPARNQAYSAEISAARYAIRAAEKNLQHPRLKRPKMIARREAQLADAKTQLEDVLRRGPRPLPRGHQIGSQDDTSGKSGIYIGPTSNWWRRDVEFTVYAADGTRWFEATVAGDDEEAQAEMLQFLWDAEKRRKERDRSPWRPSLVGD